MNRSRTGVCSAAVVLGTAVLLGMGLTSCSTGSDAPPPAPTSASASGTASGTASNQPTTSTGPASALFARELTVTQPSAFMLPSGTIACLFSGTNGAAQPKGVSCQIMQKSYTGEKPTSCPPGPFKPDTWSDRDVELIGSRKAQFACWNSQGLAPAANVKNPDGGASSLTAWWKEGMDPVVDAQGTQRAALPYGGSMRWGPVRCIITEMGVSCANTASKHMFMLSKDAVQLS